MYALYIIVFGVLTIVSALLLSMETNQNGTRKIVFRILKILLAVFGALAVGSGVYSMSPFSLAGDWQDKVVIEQNSPNDRFVASVLNTFGGAVVSNSTCVCIRPKGEKLRETKESVIFRVENFARVGIHWNDDEQLTVDYDHEAVLYKTDAWRGVKLFYVEHRSL